MECETDMWISATATVMQSVVVKKELSWKVRLSIYWSIYVPTLTYCMAMNFRSWPKEQDPPWIQAAEMSSLCRVAGCSLRDTVGWWAQTRVADPQHQASVSDGALPRTRSSNYDTQLAWERLGVLLEKLWEMSGEREVWCPCSDYCPCDPDGWMDGILNRMDYTDALTALGQTTCKW